MAKFLVQGSYTAKELRGLQKDKASGRRRAIKKAVEGLGGKLEALYYCFGDDDVILIADLPDNVTAVAVSIAASSSGLARTKTTALLTVEEIDEALKKTVAYRPPGGQGLKVDLPQQEPKAKGLSTSAWTRCLD